VSWVAPLAGLIVGALAGFVIGRRWRATEPSISPTSNPKFKRHDAAVLMDGMDDGVIASDPEGNVTLMNTAARSMLGYPKSMVPGRVRELPRGEEIATAKHLGNLAEATEIQLDGGRTVAIRVQIRSDQSTLFLLHDVTDIRKVDRVRRDFVANVSHELRTPVSVIRANAETLLDGALEDEEVARTFVSAVHRNAERISHLVSDLLDLARIEAGTMDLEITKVDVNRLVARTVSSVMTLAMSKGISIHDEVEEGTQCLADEGAVEQVLTNFIDNAVKYGIDGGNVWIRSHEVAGKVRVEIVDDGVGVPGKHRTRLFERFYRVDKGRSRAAGGTGLGLSIVKHLANSMGGQVGMEANRPKGAIFWVSLPCVESSEQ
jgi:two-component system phosphate regulon sensor histidine kinase PhoR